MSVHIARAWAGVTCIAALGLLVYAWSLPVPTPLAAPIDHPVVLYGIAAGFLLLTGATGLLLTRPDRSAPALDVLARLRQRLTLGWYVDRLFSLIVSATVYGTAMFMVALSIYEPKRDQGDVIAAVASASFGAVVLATASFWIVRVIWPSLAWTLAVVGWGAELSEMDVVGVAEERRYGRLAATRVEVRGADGGAASLLLQGDRPPLYSTRAAVRTVFVATPKGRADLVQILAADGSPFGLDEDASSPPLSRGLATPRRGD